MGFGKYYGYIFGVLSITVEGYYIERFLNMCSKENIATWNIKKEKGTYITLKINASNFKKVAQIAKELRCRVKIRKKRGINFIFRKYRKRKIFVIFILVMVIFFSIISNFIWKIELLYEGEEMEGIKEDIIEAGLEIGMYKSEIDTKEIINNIRTARDDIAWMGIEIIGTNAIVRVIQAIEIPEMIDENEYCDIVASKDGIVESINVRDGSAKVEAGDIVKKGDVLIEGIMEGLYTDARMVHSKGEIKARVWYTETVKIEYNSTELIETGDKEEKYSIKFKKNSINLYKSISNFEIYDTIETEKQIKIFSNFYLPISVVKKEVIEKQEIEKKYTIEQAQILGIQEAERKIESVIDKQSEIINKNVHTYQEEEGIVVQVTYEVIENIETKEKI